MQEEDFPAADRIISQIEAAFHQDPELREFDVILSPIDDNTSPVVHIRAEHCLGIKSWCVKPLYTCVYKQLIKLRTERVHRRHTLTPEDRQRFENLLSVALLLNPEVATFWNLRRELVARGHLEPHNELKFASLVSSFKPKASDVFVYRRWILSDLLKGMPEPKKSQTLSLEFEAVYRAACKYANNYNAWNHALWCLEAATLELKRQLLESSASWTLSHVSDHSGLQFRQQLLKSVLDSTKNVLDSTSLRNGTSVPDGTHGHNGTNVRDCSRLVEQCAGNSCKLCPPWYKEYKISQRVQNSSTNDILIHELTRNTQTIATYPGHEALWCHRRFLVYELWVRSDSRLAELLRYEESRLRDDTAVSSGASASLGKGVLLGDDTRYKVKHLHWIDKFLPLPS